MQLKIFTAQNIRRIEADANAWTTSANITRIISSHIVSTPIEQITEQILTNANINTKQMTKRRDKVEYVLTIWYE